MYVHIYIYSSILPLHAMKTWANGGIEALILTQAPVEVIGRSLNQAAYAKERSMVSIH
jgi:hypothetical protein